MRMQKGMKLVALLAAITLTGFVSACADSPAAPDSAPAGRIAMLTTIPEDYCNILDPASSCFDADCYWDFEACTGGGSDTGTTVVGGGGGGGGGDGGGGSPQPASGPEAYEDDTGLPTGESSGFRDEGQVFDCTKTKCPSPRRFYSARR